MAEDLYKTLGVARTASKEELKKAMRELSAQHHPDSVKRRQGSITPEQDKEATAKVSEVSYAYEILSDDAKRTIYDKFGHEGLKHYTPPPEPATPMTRQHYRSAGFGMDSNSIADAIAFEAKEISKTIKNYSASLEAEWNKDYQDIESQRRIVKGDEQQDWHQTAKAMKEQLKHMPFAQQKYAAVDDILSKWSNAIEPASRAFHLEMNAAFKDQYKPLGTLMRKWAEASDENTIAAPYLQQVENFFAVARTEVEAIQFATEIQKNIEGLEKNQLETYAREAGPLQAARHNQYTQLLNAYRKSISTRQADYVSQVELITSAAKEASLQR